MMTKFKKDRSRIKKKSSALDGVVVTLSGKFSQSREALRKLIVQHGGDLIVNVTKRVTHVMTTEEDAKTKTIRIQQALKYGIPLVSEAYIMDSINAGKLQEIDSYLIHPQYSKERLEKTLAESRKRMAEEEQRLESLKKQKIEKKKLEKPVISTVDFSKLSTESSESEEESSYQFIHQLDVNRKVNVELFWKEPFVDPHSGLDRKTHVLFDDNCYYTTLLTLPDVNLHDQYYLLQLLEFYQEPKWVVHSRWGVIGYKGKKQKKYFTQKEKAKQAFEEIFLEKTKVEWKNRAQFKAVTGSFYPVRLQFQRPPRKPIQELAGLGETTEESEDELIIDTNETTEEQPVEQKSTENQQLNAQTSIQPNNITQSDKQVNAQSTSSIVQQGIQST